ncbi:hypothetical protein [Psychrobacter faecalis]|uniref:hypothetical protein n=1 Tax=Psychrobacter faecalis TaxID=180588 RepID=UPI0028AEC7AA|nr:hypothetical protein [Psychrobacter faecalis]
MKPICPCCRSSAVYEVNGSGNSTIVESLFSPAMLVSLGVSICKTLKFHPAIGAVAGVALAAVIELAQPNNALPLLANKQYRCSNCMHVFSSFN